MAGGTKTARPLVGEVEHIAAIAAAALPDPCSMAAADLYAALAFPVQGYDAPAASPIACLANANVVAGTDILVVRYAEPAALTPA